MSSFFDSLEAQLGSAARARTASADPSDVPASRRRRRGLGWLSAGVAVAPILAGVLVTLVVVGAALVLAGHRGHGPTAPQGSPPPGQNITAIIAHTPQRQLRRELSYITTATAGVEKSRACRLQQPAGVTYIHGSPGPDLLSILGVLRRPATPADRLNPEAVAGTPDIYRAYVRRAFSVGGISYYIVPARYDRAASIPSDHCFALQAAALKRALPTIPASLRQPTRELQAAMVADYESMAAHAPRDTICFVYVSRHDTGTECGIPPRAISEGQAGQQDQGGYSGVVPDGVATVTLTFPATRVRPAQTMTVSVNNNVYTARVSTSSFSLSPPTVVWRSAQRRVLKRWSPPTAAARASACEQEPLACLAIEGSSSETNSGSSSGSAH